MTVSSFIYRITCRIAFIRFSKKAEAELAMSELAGYKCPGASRGLDVKVAEDHGRQKAAFYAGWIQGQQVDEGGEWAESDFASSQGGYGGRGGRGGGGYNANFGLQMFPTPGANMRGVGGNRYNPINRGGGGHHGFGNQLVGKQGGGGGYNPTGFGRAAFSGARGMPARGGFSRGGSRGSSWSS